MFNSVKIRHKVTSKTAPKDKKIFAVKSARKTFKHFLNLSKSCELVAFKKYKMSIQEQFEAAVKVIQNLPKNGNFWDGSHAIPSLVQ